MKKAMLSQPMGGKTDEEIIATREKAVSFLESAGSLCHAAYFCKGWENARGCRIEHDAAKAYGLEIIYEE